jgi:hypothetical protein
LISLREKAERLLEEHASNLEVLRGKVQQARQYDPSLRCALPVSEALNAHQPASADALAHPPTLLAVDGSQIFNDRHNDAQYGLVNLGAVQMLHSGSQPPETAVQSTLYYDESLDDLSDAALSLKRDLGERLKMAELAAQASPPVIAFTDGPLELWGSRPEGPEAASQYQQSLHDYLQVLRQLHSLKAVTAGYVDRPGADLVVRLLEVACATPPEIEQIRKFRPLHGVSDADLYETRLGPGERSAVFALQSQGARSYQGPLALHFFYLNVSASKSEPASLARVEVPAWVAEDATSLEMLHAVLVSQCRIMGTRRYPYLLHRAHEVAVVTFREQQEVTEMIVGELLRQGIPVRGRSHKQAAKDLPGRARLKP